ncbi:MAG: type II toxin-antitoxin system CcdA family antitoxin [Chromatiaceae bacterium]|jgi:antitoxin CcdA
MPEQARSTERPSEPQAIGLTALLDALVCAYLCALMFCLKQEAGMHRLFDENAPKKATNLSINSDLLAKTRALKINLSATLERALESELANVEAKKWAAENKAAIQAYNQFVEENGCFGDEFREF